VACDQLVDLDEVPAAGRLAPALLEERRVAGGLLAECPPGRLELELVLARLDVDHPQPRHVRQRAAERREVARRVRPEVAQPLLDAAAGEAARLDLLLQRLALAPLPGRLHADGALAHDPLPLAAVHALRLPPRGLRSSGS